MAKNPLCIWEFISKNPPVQGSGICLQFSSLKLDGILLLSTRDGDVLYVWHVLLAPVQHWHASSHTAALSSGTTEKPSLTQPYYAGIAYTHTFTLTTKSLSRATDI